MNKKVLLSLVFFCALFIGLAISGPKTITKSSIYKAAGSVWTLEMVDDAYFTITYAPSPSSSPTITIEGDFSQPSGSPYHAKFVVTSATGTGAPSVGTTFWGLRQDSYMIFMSNPLNPDSGFVNFINVGNCPTTPINGNWGVMKYTGSKYVDENADPSLGADVLGTFFYNPTGSGTFGLLSRYTAAGTDLGVPAPHLRMFRSVTCTDGVIDLGGGSYIYMTPSGGMSVSIAGSSESTTLIGSAVESIAMSHLPGTYIGFYNNSNSTTGGKEVQAVFDSSGNGTITEYTDPETGTLASSSLATIDFATTNNPNMGMIAGTISNGTNTKPITCNVMKNPGGASQPILYCVGASTDFATGTRTSKMVSMILMRQSTSTYPAYPAISTFDGSLSGTASDQFLINWSEVTSHTITTTPYVGTDSPACTSHSGGHIHFESEDAGPYEVNIYAPVSGTINVMDCRDSDTGDDQYNASIAFATLSGEILTFSINFEPMDGDHCELSETDPNYIDFSEKLVKSSGQKWKTGERVNKGDLIGKMWVPANTVPDPAPNNWAAHLHFHISDESGNHYCPNVFNTTVADEYDNRYRSECKPDPVYFTANDGLCSDATSSESLMGNN